MYPALLQKPTIKNRIVHYLRYHPGWHSKTQIQMIGTKHWIGTNRLHPSPDNISRRLRELANEDLIEVRTVKGLAQYKSKEQSCR